MASFCCYVNSCYFDAKKVLKFAQCFLICLFSSPFFACISIFSSGENGIVSYLYHVGCGVRIIPICCILYSIVNAFKLCIDGLCLINWLRHALVACLEVAGGNASVARHHMSDNCACTDPKITCISVAEFIEVSVLNTTNEFFLEGIVHVSIVFINCACLHMLIAELLSLCCCYITWNDRNDTWIWRRKYGVFERVAYSVGFIMSPMWPFCPPLP